MTVFFRLLQVEANEKAAALRNAVRSMVEESGDTLIQSEPGSSHTQRVFYVDPGRFPTVPGSPFGYWITEGVRTAFSHHKQLEELDYEAKQGLVTADDFRFLRTWWEVSMSSSGRGGRWVGFAKGGAWSPFYADIGLLVGYSRADQVGLQAIGRFGRGATCYYRPGLTWSLRSDGLSFRALPFGCIFSHKGPAVFEAGDTAVRLLSCVAVLNSSSYLHLLRVQLARTELAQSYEVGLVQQTPVPSLAPGDEFDLARLARRAWSIRRSLDALNETSHAFLLPSGLNERTTGFDIAAANSELALNQREIDTRVAALYGFDESERRALDSGFEGGRVTDRPDEGDDDEDASGARRVARADTLLSWMVGVAFGRFDIRLATASHDLLPVGVQREPPPEPEPFDPLPRRSPGMWPEGEPYHVTPPRILVDDPMHNHDITAHVANVAAQTGWPEPANLRAWLAKEFFPLHIKMYSKSRRKAPIYWQLATPSASYSVWLYIHAFSKDTMFHVEELVSDKVLLEERKANELRNEAGDSPSAAARKALAAQEAFLEELRGMAEEVRRVKPLWKPDLDDGVIINFAPLWRLVPQHKAWQKELRETWAALCGGEYEWSHLAMHLWPERVVPKCATDRSFAIAHGLEDVFWFEDANGKWKPRATPTRPVADLIAERTSAAVTAARDSLINAPTPGGGGGGKKKRAAPKARRPGR